ncbi:zonular occludens toxin [Comamonas thiooxydans]|uniref:zonular occludens toxin domain-containing protein n=1 Tax=Comamonas thiooxydans TaxID=363952 RepID=UPI000622A9EB|nr:zonular occludens toxin domain-containing protein [Comamonas thiooxydans]KKI11988.1 zonular occludens toxin [Comamonas thiooxydans]
MPINFVTGLPRQGKTLFTFIQVKERAAKENRPIYYCNIPEVTLPGWIEIQHPDEWMNCPNDSIIVVDELQDFWGLSSSGAKVPLPILELSKHGKRGIDFYFITQDPTLVHATPRKLCEIHWHVVRAFGSENAVAHKFSRMQTDPEKVKKKSEKLPWRYPKEAFGKKDKAGNWITKPWYKSADVHNIKRQIPLKVWAIPGVLVLAGLAGWAAISLFGNTLDKAKGGVPGQAVATAPGAPAAAPGQPGQAGASPKAAPRTTAQYLADYKPRLQDFPHTAPAYDQVTQPVEAPYPAACVVMKSKGCKCFTQQATLMSTSEEVCRLIVEKGYFVDWRMPLRQAPERPQQTAVKDDKHQVQQLPMPAVQPVQLAQQQPQQKKDLGYLESLAMRNAQVRSNLME